LVLRTFLHASPTRFSCHAKSRASKTYDMKSF
jgi:hypothetical protein